MDTMDLSLSSPEEDLSAITCHKADVVPQCTNAIKLQQNYFLSMV